MSSGVGSPLPQSPRSSQLNLQPQPQPQPRPPWPNYLASYMPDLEYGRPITESLEYFEKERLSEDTAVHILTADDKGVVGQNEVLDYDGLYSHIRDTQVNPPSFRFISINRYLTVSTIKSPRDATRFRISKKAFRHLISAFEISPTFISAVANEYIPLGQGSRQHMYFYDPDVFDFWYELPVRIQVKCTDQTQEHVSSIAGRSQMNPQYYLHLLERKVDIRGSQISVYFQYNRRTRSTNLIVFSFLDGRWPKIVQEPLKRIKESLEFAESIRTADDPFFVHVVYLTSVVYWWLNVLSSCKDQLITHDTKVQEFESNSKADPNFNHRINKALHCMVAHLHRYGSELDMLGDAIECIDRNHDEFFQSEQHRPGEYDPSERVTRCLVQIKSQLRSAIILRRELECKVSNILNLVREIVKGSGRISEMVIGEFTDETIVANGDTMNNIMKATQAEAVQSKRMALQSQRLAEEMKEDSIAMKTIAILTLVFLPGTSFAAILAMPFFNDNSWMKGIDKLWVWVLLTVPATGLAFLFYLFWRKRELDRKKKDATLELQETGAVL